MTMKSPQNSSHSNDRPANSRQNPTILALGAGMLAFLALLLAAFSFTEDRRHERGGDETAKRASTTSGQTHPRMIVDALTR